MRHHNFVFIMVVQLAVFPKTFVYVVLRDDTEIGPKHGELSDPFLLVSWSGILREKWGEDLPFSLKIGAPSSFGSSHM